MFDNHVQQVHFALVRNGYDRRQVDAKIAEHEQRATEARARIEQAEADLAEATRRAEALEAKLSRLRDRPPDDASGLAAPVADLAEQFLETVGAAGRELPNRVLSQAESERAEIERTASNLTQVARFRAARLVGSAKRDLDDAERLADESRRQVDEYLSEGRSAARARAQEVWERARDRLREPMLEVDEMREQCRAKLRELRDLEDRRDEYWGRVTAGPAATDPIAEDPIADAR